MTRLYVENGRRLTRGGYLAHVRTDETVKTPYVWQIDELLPQADSDCAIKVHRDVRGNPIRVLMVLLNNPKEALDAITSALINGPITGGSKTAVWCNRRRRSIDVDKRFLRAYILSSATVPEEWVAGKEGLRNGEIERPEEIR
ncbi:hypothetical protein K0M31_014021 [Melipona bicolor]|uniref:Uncharacterized protein n=1 Tax=Melipona bicolor TaxID=60889 RepID=A0AA40G8X1_9HYME|nr:hypothetical protein K0M31_014021 [Melipona bicolor]